MDSNGLGQKLNDLLKLENEPVAIKWSVKEPKNVEKEEGKSRFCNKLVKAMDFLTSKGVPLLYPFTLQRFSAEIYYYIDVTTAVIALAVLLILYLRLDMKYKKAAMIIFMIVLVSFGGIRAYEKNAALAENPVSGNLVYSTAYPTADMDRGGITIEDDVLVGPKVNLITINHPLDPSERQSTISNPIVIKKNAWIGVGAVVMPGVTIGENSVVSAAAVVTKDVPPNTVVAGIPAKIIKTIE